MSMRREQPPQTHPDTRKDTGTLFLLLSEDDLWNLKGGGSLAKTIREIGSTLSGPHESQATVNADPSTRPFCVESYSGKE